MFLQINGYPFFWSLDELADCLRVNILSPDGSLLGVAWGSWDEPGILRFHGCAAKGARLPFFTSDLVDQLCRLAFAVGADKVVTSHTLNPNRKPLDRFLLMLGFEKEDQGFSRNLWTEPHGQQEEEHHSGRLEQR
ncbi:hypothetical protein SAMN02983003_0629 [Devosia enhydra]|uniref:N-acetyltransferase domain-containing protein n=1 Tax=Devosia enhydra TaxID=665118 RepID=A0A1K2HTR3_9HYPH|nr:hypothetical protein [Devosia enhydra]SFZ81677.1 hypothetical protein SAMN02983003_0629 [Devosia enhydra]